MRAACRKEPLCFAFMLECFENMKHCLLLLHVSFLDITLASGRGPLRRTSTEFVCQANTSFEGLGNYCLQLVM